MFILTYIAIVFPGEKELFHFFIFVFFDVHGTFGKNCKFITMTDLHLFVLPYWDREFVLIVFSRKAYRNDFSEVHLFKVVCSLITKSTVTSSFRTCQLIRYGAMEV